MALQLEVLKNEGAHLQVHLKHAEVGLVNALRRAILSDLPCFAIDRVDFYENTSSMFNEYLANRIGLIPLTWEESVAEDAQVTFSLNVEGPCMVYSRDLRSNDDKIRVFNENIPLIKLAADQRLRFEAFALKGTLKQHAKFQSALASYSLVPERGKASVMAEADRDDEKGERNFKENEYIFLVESYNNLSAKEQLQRGIRLLQQKLDALEDAKDLK